jgi:hypothetical protein
MTYNQAIENIMPEVHSGSSEPFIVYRDRNKEWHIAHTNSKDGAAPFRLSTARAYDPLALQLAGSDFRKGSYQSVYDSILCGRAREQWNKVKGMSRTPSFMGLEKRDVEALVSFFEDNIGELSNDAVEYIASTENPLAALAELNPHKMLTYDKDSPYNYRLAKDAIDQIELAVFRRRHKCNDRAKLMPRKKPKSLAE